MTQYTAEQLGLNPFGMYAHPQSGDVQTGQDWADDAETWHTDDGAPSAREQAATLIRLMPYTVSMTDDTGAREEVEIHAMDVEDARAQAEDEARDWAHDGIWDGWESVTVYYRLMDDDHTEVHRGHVEVDVENH